ncbi:ATP-binding protein [Variovorax sp. LjRoot178]|uniref:ATP-binding protein n=1 Tax=Variovorax sp. LjRoot178 TaxID=3342277 RepID=UPI003ECFEE90
MAISAVSDAGLVPRPSVIQPVRAVHGAASPAVMRIIFGFDDPLLQRGQQVPVAWSEADAVNGHMLLAGKSGSGKTFSLRRIVRQITRAQRNVRVHLMDVHGDLELDDCSTVIFSESTPYGINPLKLSSNPHYGGVRKRIQAFIEMVNDSSRTPMGDRQVASLRNLLQDLYAMHGFRADDASTWHEEPGSLPSGEGRVYLDIPFDSKDSAKDAARAAGLTLQFDRDAKCWWTDRHEGPLERYPQKRFGKHYPSLAEAAAFAKTRLRTLTTGGGTKSTRLLEEHNKRVVSWQAKARKFGAGLGNGEDVEEARQEVERGVDDVIESFSEYVAGIATGKELDALIRYDSMDTIRSIVNRLETIVASGIYRSAEPPFDDAAPVWRYNLTALSGTEQKMFVWTRLTEIFEHARERGIVKGAAELRDVIVVDEAHQFFADKDTNILDRLAKEARKFGVALIAASQSPTHFSEDFLANCGTKILLGLDSLYFDGTVRKMRIDKEVLNAVVPGKVAAIQTSVRGEQAPQFKLVRVSG